MQEEQALSQIYYRAKGLFESLSKCNERVISGAPIEICNKLVIEINSCQLITQKSPVGKLDSWPLIDSPERHNAYRESVMSKLSEIIALIESKINGDKLPDLIKRKNIFISHGKNKETIHLMERFIYALGLDPVIVKEEPSKGGSVNPVVQDYLSQSACVILLSTADYKDEDGKWHSSENVINEEGLAKKYVGEKIIYLLEDKVDIIPSNYSEKIYERFNANNMTEAFIKVGKELKAFKIF